jgi:hypothetical protein
MSNENYPAGVTDAHPHFNDEERPVTVQCTSDESLVIPSFMVKAELQDILALAATGNKAGTETALHNLLSEIGDLEKEGGYECTFEGELDLPVSVEAEWDCPRCGSTQTTDTLPDEVDPDEAYERLREERNDD